MILDLLRVVQAIPRSLWVVVGVVLVAVVWAGKCDLENWEQYAREHNCKPTGVVKQEFAGMVCNDYGAGMTTCTPLYSTRKEWECDGGERILR